LRPPHVANDTPPAYGHCEEGRAAPHKTSFRLRKHLDRNLSIVTCKLSIVPAAYGGGAHTERARRRNPIGGGQSHAHAHAYRFVKIN
jgi:hypothetical protein